MSNDSLNDVIEDSMNDLDLGEETEETTEEVVETQAEETATADESIEETKAAATEETTEPEAIFTTEPVKTTEDDFSKRFGLPAQSVTGRENRIPYSRVKKIIEKNEKDVVARITKELEEKFTPQLTEHGGKIKDYEEKLNRVAQFEQVMGNDPKTFLGWLSQIPAYKEFFELVNKAAEGQTTDKGATPPVDNDPMPPPNKLHTDGSKFYDMDGLKDLMSWQSRQVEGRVTKQYEEKLTREYGPIKEAWQRNETAQKMLPEIDKLITEARTWPLFNENEADITKALAADKALSLEGAYRKVVLPKLATDRNKLRTELLAEIKKQPATTSAPVRSGTPKKVSTQPKTTEEVILAALQREGVPVDLVK